MEVRRRKWEERQNREGKERGREGERSVRADEGIAALLDVLDRVAKERIATCSYTPV